MSNDSESFSRRIEKKMLRECKTHFFSGNDSLLPVGSNLAGILPHFQKKIIFTLKFVDTFQIEGLINFVKKIMENVSKCLSRVVWVPISAWVL